MISRARDNRHLALEQLEERRVMSAGTDAAPQTRLDVNADGQVAMSDAVMVVDYLNDPNSVRRVDPVKGSSYDTSGDGFISRRDALLIINAVSALRDWQQPLDVNADG